MVWSSAAASRSYNIIGVVSGSLSEDAQCLFEKAGLAGYNQEFAVVSSFDGPISCVMKFNYQYCAFC